MATRATKFYSAEQNFLFFNPVWLVSLYTLWCSQCTRKIESKIKLHLYIFQLSTQWFLHSHILDRHLWQFEPQSLVSHVTVESLGVLVSRRLKQIPEINFFFNCRHFRFLLLIWNIDGIYLMYNRIVYLVIVSVYENLGTVNGWYV